MTNEQAQKVLDELQGVRPEKLNGEAKRLFEAIMKIADKRDNLKEEVEQKDKIINLMADYMSDIDDEMFCDDEEKYDGEIFIGCDEDCQKCVIKYFKNKAKGKK